MVKRLSRRRIIPYGHQWITEKDIQAVTQVLRSDWLTQGPNVDTFEKALTHIAGSRDVVVFSSGTAALHAACFALGLKKGDEVVTTPMTFVATSNAVLYQGATPRFVDIDESTGNIDPIAVQRAVNKKTKAIIAVDFAGNPCDWRSLLRIARKNKLCIIEDASHALGAKYFGKPVGSFADLTIFSFHPVKHITSGEGGAIATNHDRFAILSRRFRQHGITRNPREMSRNEGPWYYEMLDLGFNYRLTDIQCALGLSQLKRLKSFLAKRAEIVETYNRAFVDLPHVLLPVKQLGTVPAWHLYVLRLTGPLQKLRGKIFVTLRERGLGVNVHYIPVPLQPYYRKRFGYKQGDFPKAENFYNSALSLPLYPAMKFYDIKRVITTVREVIGSYASCI